MQAKINLELIDKKLSKKKINRSGFAKQLGISRSLLSYYIKNPTLKSIEKIADGLGLKAKDLIP